MSQLKIYPGPKPSRLHRVAEDLARQQLKGKSLADILRWLRTRHGINANAGEVAAFLDDLDPDLKARLAAADQAMADLASPGCQPAASPSLDFVMAQYRSLVLKKISEGDTSQAALTLVDKMVRTLMNYEQGNERLRQKERDQNLKEAALERQRAENERHQPPPTDYPPPIEPLLPALESADETMPLAIPK